MEVLHVVLLGFVKYFWRDAIARLSVANKALLILRISSLNTSRLDLPPCLSGKTYVQFAGSLVGRDFRVIAQIAPFVLYNMLPDECYKAWLSLSNLVPLIWQPCIQDLEVHAVCSIYWLWSRLTDQLLDFIGECHQQLSEPCCQLVSTVV